MSTELHERLSVQHAVSQALADADTIEHAIEQTLTAIVTRLGWDEGVFWLRDALGNALYVAHRWPATASAGADGATPSRRLACNEELAGRVWSARTALWEPDPNAQSSRARGRFAFPVATREEFLGVVELHGSRVEPPTDTLLATLAGIGQQVAQFIARRRAVDAEAAARRLSAAMIAVALDCIVTIDEEGRVLEFNPAAESTFGFTRDQVLGKAMVDFIVPPALRDAHRHGMARYLATGKANVLGRRIEVSGQRATGEVFPVELTILRVDQPGPPVFTAYLRDLTEQKRLESIRSLLLGATEMLASSLDYEETLRNLSRVVVPAFADWYAVDVVEPNGAIRRLEVAHRDPTKIALARTLAERYPEDPNQEHGVRRVIATGRSELLREIPEALLTSAARDAEHLALLRALGLRSAIVVPLRLADHVAGAMTLVTAESDRRYDERDLAVAEDLAQRASAAIEKARLFAEVSDARALLEHQAVELEAQAEELEQTAGELEMTVEDLRHANEALRDETLQAEESRREADEANRAKSDFLASMSHELRTPLNAIIGYAQLLEIGVHGMLQPRQLDDMRRIDRSAQHLLGLITDILNFAKIEAGRLEFKLERVALSEVVARVEELIAPQAAAKHLSYDVVMQCSDVHVCADEEKLVQIFVNLVSNAVRYTPEGGSIRIECRATDERVWTDVCDTGVGIPADKLQMAFEPFVQVDRSYVGDRQGTGLGLAISRDLARGMGGDLTVRSVVGKGSVFSLELKREP